jgi:hypothetical protein
MSSNAMETMLRESLWAQTLTAEELDRVVRESLRARGAGRRFRDAPRRIGRSVARRHRGSGEDVGLAGRWPRLHLHRRDHRRLGRRRLAAQARPVALRRRGHAPDARGLRAAPYLRTPGVDKPGLQSVPSVAHQRAPEPVHRAHGVRPPAGPRCARGALPGKPVRPHPLSEDEQLRAPEPGRDRASVGRLAPARQPGAARTRARGTAAGGARWRRGARSRGACGATLGSEEPRRRPRAGEAARA